MPEAYDRWLAPAVFRPFAADLAERAARLNPARLLEIAAGTGVLTTELVAALPDAEITATDLNVAMVEYGSHQAPAANWQQADALSLSFGDGEFDLVTCQFGVMFFPDKQAAFREMRRVLRPGGTVLFSTWAAIDTHGFAVALLAGMERAFPDDPPTFIAAVPHGYPDLDQVVVDLAGAGLDRVSAHTVILEGYAESAAGVGAGFCTGTPLRMAIESRGDLAANTAVISDEMTNLLGPGPVTAQMTAHVIEAAPAA